jgi:translation initiation factor 1
LLKAVAVTEDRIVADRENTRTVYSTATGGKCPVCGWPQRNCQCSSQHHRDEPVPERLVAKLRLEKKGRGGKAVTVVYGLPRNEAFLKELSQTLKRTCGTGGAVTEDGVELQGDLRDRVRDWLRQHGYTVKG